jgi:hypothetical protein
MPEVTVSRGRDPLVIRIRRWCQPLANVVIGDRTKSDCEAKLVFSIRSTDSKQRLLNTCWLIWCSHRRHHTSSRSIQTGQVGRRAPPP